MKKITFRRQVIIGAAALGIGHFLWFLTDIGYFVNLAFLFYGSLLLIHPVAPAPYQTTPSIRRYIRIAAVVVILIGLTMRNGDGNGQWRREVSRATGLHTRWTSVVSAMDDHSGFHGDGSTCVVLDFSEQPLSGCPAVEGWHDLPLTENVSALIYGSETEELIWSPQPETPLPQAEQGFWFFYDRQGESYSEEAVLSRHSYNYDFALYDGSTDLLYYFEYDT